MLLIGKPSISMGHLYHGYVSHNQRVKLNKRKPLLNHPPIGSNWGVDQSRLKILLKLSQPWPSFPQVARMEESSRRLGRPITKQAHPFLRGSRGSLQPVAQLMCNLDFAWYIGCFPKKGWLIMLGNPMGWMSIKPCSETM